MEDDPKTVFAIANEVEAIGSIGLMVGRDVHRFTAELGYWLAEPYTTNTASARLLEKAGFKYEGLLRASAFKDDRLVDQHKSRTFYFVLLFTEFITENSSYVRLKQKAIAGLFGVKVGLTCSLTILWHKCKM